jgi:hypothetical protein
VGSRSKARARAKASQLPAQRSPAPHRPVTPPTPQEAQPPSPPPRSVLVAAVVQAVEATGVLAASGWALAETLGGHSYQRSSGVAITLIGIGTAIALAFVARGLRAERRWSRTPALLTQLFTGIVAVYLLQAPRLDLGIPAIVLAIAGFGALLAPASFRSLTPGRISKG